MDDLFERKYTRRVYVLAWLLFVAIAIVFNFTGIAILKSIYGIVSACILGLLLFKAQNKRRIVGAGVFFFLYLFIIDTLSVLFFTIFSGKTIEMVRSNVVLLFVCGLGNQIMLLCFYKPIVALMKKHKFDIITFQQNLFLIILALFEAALLIYIMSFIDKTSSGVMLTMMITGFLGLDTYLIYLFETISQKYELEREIDLKKQQEEMQNSYYHSIETQYDHSRRLIHDIKNHMQTLEEIYSEGSNIEAKQYAKTILESMDTFSGRFKCKNRVLTIIINDKILKCDDQSIRIDTQVEDLNFDFIDPFDMTTIFSNLLDNAIEACSKVSIERREIDLKIYKFNEFITISVRNYYDGKLVWDKDSLVSTKGGKHMGLGLKNVKSAVEKYEGTMQRKSDGEHFEVKILMSPESRTDI
ncbi:sensor histidine kinase [Eubacterium callanderi]